MNKISILRLFVCAFILISWRAHAEIKCGFIFDNNPQQLQQEIRQLEVWSHHEIHLALNSQIIKQIAAEKIKNNLELSDISWKMERLILDVKGYSFVAGRAKRLFIPHRIYGNLLLIHLRKNIPLAELIEQYNQHLAHEIQKQESDLYLAQNPYDLAVTELYKE